MMWSIWGARRVPGGSNEESAVVRYPVRRLSRGENMTLGIALLLIFILYLIDKHNEWRRAAMIAGGLVVLAILAMAGVYG
jgi:hypothetical protein